MKHKITVDPRPPDSDEMPPEDALREWCAEVEQWLKTEALATRVVITPDGCEINILFTTGYEISVEDQAIILDMLSIEGATLCVGKFNLADRYAHYFYFDGLQEAQKALTWLKTNMVNYHDEQILKLDLGEGYQYPFCLYFCTAGPINTNKLYNFAEANCNLQHRQTCVSVYDRDE